MADGHHGRVGHHAAACVDRGYLKDYAIVLTPYRRLVGEIAQGTQQINGCVKLRPVQVWKTNSGKRNVIELQVDILFVTFNVTFTCTYKYMQTTDKYTIRIVYQSVVYLSASESDIKRKK